MTASPTKPTWTDSGIPVESDKHCLAKTHASFDDPNSRSGARGAGWPLRSAVPGRRRLSSH